MARLGPASAHLSTRRLTAALLIALANCGDPPFAMVQPGEPFQTEWETVVSELPFPLTGDGRVSVMTVGRKPYDDNFANRGTIEILFDHDAETITIEMRKYAVDDEIAVYGDGVGMTGIFKKTSIWAYVISGNPHRPEEQDPTKNCTVGTWKDNCAVYVYYDGQSQPIRSGADLRVHLPRGYRGELLLTTQDNVQAQAYPRRGDLIVDGLCGSGDFSLESGKVRIRMCDDLSPAPMCPPEDLIACETYPDGGGTQAWSKACPCGDGSLFGTLRIRASQPAAADITVDIPSTVWLNATLQNTAPTKPHSCYPSISNCENDCVLQDGNDVYTLAAEFNHPSLAAPKGAGYNLTMISGGCTVIPYIDVSTQWRQDGETSEELRGAVTLCTGCLK